MNYSENNKQSLFKKLFCCYFLKLRNVREAGIKAGFSADEAFSEGMKILETQSAQKCLSKLSDKTSSQNGLVRAGLERLAFGSSNDAVSLVFSEEAPSDAEILRLDLFNVSEIKRVKGGGVEVKLFDRQKALEKLWEMENSADVNSSAESFFNALAAGNSSEKEGEKSEND